MDDKRIVELYFERSEDAISETDKKYGRYCSCIAKNILNSLEDTKEIVNDTYLKVWNTIPPNVPRSLKYYVGKICRQLALNRFESKNALKRGGRMTVILDELSECLGESDESGSFVDSIALRDAMNTFVGSLPTKTRNVFVRRYWYASSIEEIATQYSMKESTVTVLLLRTRNKLRVFLEKEGFIL